MKKHILGLTIFGFIFASFAFAFAFFYAPPIPEVEEVRLPVYKSEPTVSCRKSVKKTKNIEYKVISSQYFADEDKLVSIVKVDWKGGNDLPKEIAAEVSFTYSRDWKARNFAGLQKFKEPFADSRSKMMTIVSKIPYDFDNKLNSKENNYVIINISDDIDEVIRSDYRSDLIEPTPVVFVHGEKSKASNSFLNRQ